jgi:hypothetical protein
MSTPRSFLTVLSVNIFVEAVFWGVHCVTYAWSTYALLHSKRRPEPLGLWSLIVFSTLFWLIGTTDMGTSLYIGLEELLNQDNPSESSSVSNTVVLESVSDVFERVESCYELTVNLVAGQSLDPERRADIPRVCGVLATSEYVPCSRTSLAG